MNKLVFFTKYTRQSDKLLTRRPQLVKPYHQVLWLLRHDIGSSKIALHKLQGRDDHWSVSVTQDVRIIFAWKQNSIFLLMIGSHDEVY